MINKTKEAIVVIILIIVDYYFFVRQNIFPNISITLLFILIAILLTILIGTISGIDYSKPRKYITNLPRKVFYYLKSIFF